MRSTSGWAEGVARCGSWELMRRWSKWGAADGGGLVTDATTGELLGLDVLVVRDSAGFLDGLGLGELLAA